MTRIHSLATVSRDAQLGQHVTVGPFAVIESDVVIGDGCQIASHAVIKSGTVMGAKNQIGEYAVVGGMPQHLHLDKLPGKLLLGDGNLIREHVTTLGDRNLLMVGAHVAHDCQVGNDVVMANNTLLGGHVQVGNGAFFGGAAAVHQFCRIGTLAMVGGLARVLKDVPPYLTLDGGTGLIVGLNVVGLRRSGMKSSDLQQIKQAYRVIYRSGLVWREIVPALKSRFPEGPASAFAAFLAEGSRGISTERRVPPGATVRLHREDDNEFPPISKAG